MKYKKYICAAGCMLLTGAAVCTGTSLYSRNTAQKAAEVLADPTETPETEAEKYDTIENTEEEETQEDEFVPSPEELNLAHYFPEGADPEDVTKSYAGEAFEVLMKQDESWMSGIYSYSDMSPVQLAARLGRPSSDVTGHFNPNDSSHNPDDPDTWTVNSFKDIRMSVTDGDDNPISVYSNVIDIMSMANVYTYYHGIEDYDLFLSYAKTLWEESHSYSVSMSDVYYCSGCLDEDSEKRELEALEEEAKAEAARFVPEEGSMEEGAIVRYYDETEASEEEPTAGIITSGRGIRSTADEAALEARHAAENETLPSDRAADDSYVDLRIADDLQETEVSFTSSSDSPVLESAGSETDGDEMSASGTSTQEQRASENTSGQETATPSNASSENKKADIAGKTVKASTKCPGHVDLKIQMKIKGLDEKKGLYEADKTCSSAEENGADGWTGWTEENRTSAKNLSYQDWYRKYGLSLSVITMSNPLTSAEIEEYMEELPQELSEDRRKLIEFALSSVGKVPYYWGGKASKAGYKGNNFGTLVSPDTKGRVMKGLDCSGWINWVYWSALGERLPYESTSGLAVLGTKISREQLQPGDIVLRTGEDAHVIMFLGWTEDGKIRCIHESSSGVNNVTVATRDAYWPYYRKLVN